MYSFFYPRPIPLWCGYCQYSIPVAKGFNKEYHDEDSCRLVHGENKEVYKDDFVSGFVPRHNHGSVDYTSLVDGHVHQCLDVTYPPIPSEDGSHIHYTEGYVLFEDGHNHYYKAWSGPAIPVGNGMHVHSYDFYTTMDDGHRHRVMGVDIPAPGTL